MSSIATSQFWPASDTDYAEDTIPINGILQRREHGGDEKRAYVWTSSFIEKDSNNIHRASFTSGASASRNTKAENEDYMQGANEVSKLLHDSLKNSAFQWGAQCRTQQSADPLREAEKSAFEDFVNRMEGRYSDIGLGSVDPETMKQVLQYGLNQGDLSSGGYVVGANMEEGDDMKVAGMPFVRTGASTGYDFLSQQPAFYHGA
ncbi:hypothetical protein B9479_004326 [Cryptococcus floricola]|uniref:Uncharacterized protein n=1 Tax=Cryptococcus floricola TaxID=2591691 RepID=A0A5D3AUA7_9TREE|nr:hypothetical protein B9479_004326 [Cryptococcus floricola]